MTPTDFLPAFQSASQSASTTVLPAATAHGTRAALLFALVAERLSAFYEHGQWLTQAQGATLCADWLARTRRALPLDERRRLSELGDALAREIEAGLSREAGLCTAHELMEALAANQLSEIGEAIMAECARRLPLADVDIAPSAGAGAGIAPQSSR